MDAMPTKRKWEDVDDSDEETPSLGRQVLPVAVLPHDFDGEPMDGMQYLFTVRRDARMLPHVTRVPNPYEVEEAMPVPAPRDRIQVRPLPLEEWRDVFLKRFRNFRKNSLQPTGPAGESSTSTFGKVIPDKKERDLWWAFLAGHPETVWNPPKKPKVPAKMHRQRQFSCTPQPISKEWAQEGRGVEAFQVDPLNTQPPMGTTPPYISQPCSSYTTNQTSSNTDGGREPTPSLLRNIDHQYSLHLLMYFAHWINHYLEEPHPRKLHVSEAHARWIFVLLSRVDDYVSADEMNLLRNLARACIGLLKELVRNTLPSATDPSKPPEEPSSQQMSERSCWLIIQIVVGHWAQRDLWTDVEMALSESSGDNELCSPDIHH